MEQAKRELEQLLERVSYGEEMILTQDGRVVARIVQEANPVPIAEAYSQRIGWGKDLVLWVSPDFDAPMDEFSRYV